MCMCKRKWVWVSAFACAFGVWAFGAPVCPFMCVLVSVNIWECVSMGISSPVRLLSFYLYVCTMYTCIFFRLRSFTLFHTPDCWVCLCIRAHDIIMPPQLLFDATQSTQFTDSSHPLYHNLCASHTKQRHFFCSGLSLFRVVFVFGTQ